MSEYTYFLAKGRSLVAIETVDAAKAAIQAVEKTLRFQWNAEQVTLSLDDEGQGQALVFFNRKDGLREGWQPVRTVSSRFMTTLIEARPAHNVRDSFALAAGLGKVQMALCQARLEDVFQCGEMPMRFLDMGKTSTAFVRDGFLEGRRDTRDGGKIKDHVTDERALVSRDALDYMQLAGAYYIRVPNDEVGAALFSPPDAVIQSFDVMLQKDAEEYRSRYHPDLPPWTQPSLR